MDLNLSLDEFIRRRKAEAGFSSGISAIKNEDDKFNKYDIDKDELDAELDEMMGATNNDATQEPNTSYRSSVSKFDRISMQGSDNEDEDGDVEMLSTQNSSIKFAKEIEQMDHPNCCKFKPFTTIEDKMRVKIKSQQWRLNGGNPGVEDANSGIRRGRIGKNYRNRTENVVRGNFTYRQNGNGIAGIVRNNKPKPIFYDNVATGSGNEETSLILRKVVHAPGLARPISVDVNLTSLGVNPFIQRPAPDPAPIPIPVEPRPPPAVIPKGMAHLEMSIEADDLMSFLKAKKEYEEKYKAATAAASSTSQYEHDAFSNISQM